MKRIIPALLSTLIAACAGPIKPTEPATIGVFSNPELRTKLQEQYPGNWRTRYEGQAVKDKATCMIEAAKIPIPSPSCTAVSRNCAGLVGFARGFCQGAGPIRDCDYSSVHAAEAAKDAVLESCMQLKGWQFSIEPNPDPNAAPGSKRAVIR